MRTDGQTDRRKDMTTLIVAFRNFANAPKNNFQDSEAVITPELEDMVHSEN
jgi:hypothetical protein